MSEFQEFPKVLYFNGELAGNVVVVFDSEEEAAKIEEGYKTEATAADDTQSDDKDALIAKAKELGIPATKNWGVAKLEAAIADAEAALAAVVVEEEVAE
jgi:hypothetical protein